jgi:hypothetical protein
MKETNRGLLTILQSTKYNLCMDASVSTDKTVRINISDLLIVNKADKTYLCTTSLQK